MVEEEPPSDLQKNSDEIITMLVLVLIGLSRMEPTYILNAVCCHPIIVAVSIFFHLSQLTGFDAYFRWPLVCTPIVCYQRVEASYLAFI